MQILVSMASGPTARLSKKERKKNATRKPRKQSAVVPWRFNKHGELQVLLVSSSHSNKWGLPKGGVEPDMTKRKSAETEAYEEAGLLGNATKKLGKYAYVKGATGRPQKVDVYAMEVTRRLKEWPESERRERKWFSIEKARKKLPNALSPMLEKLEGIVD